MVEVEGHVAGTDAISRARRRDEPPSLASAAQLV